MSKMLKTVLHPLDAGRAGKMRQHSPAFFMNIYVQILIGIPV
jgi:hypothetical protein